MRIRRKDDVFGNWWRWFLVVAGFYFILAHSVVLYTLLVKDGMNFSQIIDKYSYIEMMLPTVAACWLGFPASTIAWVLTEMLEVEI